MKTGATYKRISCSSHVQWSFDQVQEWDVLITDFMLYSEVVGMNI